MASSEVDPTRLCELAAPTSSEKALLQVLAAMDPGRPSAFAKRRVRARLAAIPRRPRGLKGAAFALMFLGGTASALVGTGMLAGVEEEKAVEPRALPAAADVKPTIAPGSGAALPDAETVEEVRSAAPKPRAGKAARHAATVRKVAAQKMAQGEDPTKVVEALQALRKEGDPARAQKLLTGYMADNPEGALSEDALALSIEAAHAKGDRRARTYARRYLAKFPKGRHRALARRALAR